MNPPTSPLESGLDLVQELNGILVGAPIINQNDFEALCRVVLRFQRLNRLLEKETRPLWGWFFKVKATNPLRAIFSQGFSRIMRMESHQQSETNESNDSLRRSFRDFLICGSGFYQS